MTGSAQRIGKFSLVLAFLLLPHQCCCSITGHAELSSKPHLNNGDKYELFDLAKLGQKQVSSPGTTTHIYTSGEVNDDFWRKYLGEDFKKAIHVEVGDDVDSQAVVDQDLINNYDMIDKFNEQKLIGARKASSNKTQPLLTNVKEVENVNLTKHNSKESTMYMHADDHHGQTKRYIDNINRTTSEQNVHVKRDNTPAPVIINLPDNQKIFEVQETFDNNAQVVVSLPPVIYHSDPYTQVQVTPYHRYVGDQPTVSDFNHHNNQHHTSQHLKKYEKYTKTQEQ